ncbi:MAG: alcohol dehydrogenase, partial [Chloroflexota bacterium]|nr:alcohol dehydrogenase [Chloroflexota bacterium]
ERMGLVNDEVVEVGLQPDRGPALVDGPSAGSVRDRDAARAASCVDAEQDLLLVLSDQGELALVKAAPDQFTELAKFPAIEGKTWNHPVLVGDVLITASGESGIRRLAVAHGPGGWTAEERWTALGLKPYFNDFVVHEGHAFGFDGRILASIDLANGQRKWKGGRYGNGQLVLLPDQDVMLVLSEEGELALVRATPDQFTELARFKAIEGKTWNHPVLAGNVLLVRNGAEMAAFRLPLAGR